MNDSLYKLITESPTECTSILHNGRMINAGENRNFKTALYLNNDKLLGTKRRSFVQFDCNSFDNNEVSFSIWIAPKKQSNDNSIIVSNETTSGTTGLFLNSNGISNQLGVVWNEDGITSPTNLGVKLEEDVWSHLVIIFYSTGIVKTFKNGIYMSKTDMGMQTDVVNFSNIKVGGFCGWVDDFHVYKQPLDFGGVLLNQTASENVAYLFNTSRITGELEIPTTLAINNTSHNFYYMQTEEYVNSHENYKLQQEYNHDHYEDSSKYRTDGGQNSDRLRIADGSFRTFPGKIIPNSV
jgi:hypothetical protein